MSLLLQKDANVLKEITKMELQEFFNISYKFIADCLIYQRTRIVDASWKAEQYDRLEKQKDEVEALFNLYANIESTMGVYFKSTYCLARLTDFFKVAVPQSSSPARISIGAPVEQVRAQFQTGESGYRKR
jgi:hypothetical protein